MLLECYDDAFERFQEYLEKLGYTESHIIECNRFSCAMLSFSNIETLEEITHFIHRSGFCLLKISQFSKAEVYCEVSLKIKETLLTACTLDLDVAGTTHQIGKCLLEMDKHNDALIYFKKSLQLREKASMDTSVDSDVAVTLLEISLCCSFQGNYQDAKSSSKRALKIKEKISLDVKTDLEIANSLLVLAGRI